MYQKYAEAQGWKAEVLEANVTGIGGYKEVIMMISGDNVFSKLKYESGAHRVQRVPSNRITRTDSYIDSNRCSYAGSGRSRNRIS